MRTSIRINICPKQLDNEINNKIVELKIKEGIKLTKREYLERIGYGSRGSYYYADRKRGSITLDRLEKLEKHGIRVDQRI